MTAGKDSLLKKLIKVIHSEIGKTKAPQHVKKKAAAKANKVIHKKKAKGTATTAQRWAVVGGKNRTSKKTDKGKCKARTSSGPRVYVLQLADGCVYVGKTSRSVQTRLAEHMNSQKARFAGAAFTRVHPPTGKLLKRLGNLEGEGDGPERDETLRQMFKRGPNKVRGWKYVRPGDLTREDLEDIERNVREVFDLCRRCGKKGHFTLQCREQRDRHGKSLV